MNETRPSNLPVWIAGDARSLRLLDLAHKVAQTRATLLIRGESGTGKELLAQLIHYLGTGRDEPLVKIDCASLPAELLESELFGYEKGAFTGASQSKLGRMELAGNGTLMLDEIAALDLPLQAKLLRVIEERSFERLGGHATIHIHARLLTLTNVDLESAVAQRSFREDLFYRLNVVPLVIPPLRERRGDILPLADHFLQVLSLVHRRPPARLHPGVRKALETYDFPGNVRELRNLIERAIVFASGDELQLQDFPSYLARGAGYGAEDKTLEEVERAHIAAILHRYRGKKSLSARILGISRKTLLEKRKRYNLD